MKAVAWNGLEVAFDVLQQRWPRLRRPDGQPIRVLIVGTGMVGKHQSKLPPSREISCATSSTSSARVQA